MPTLDQILEGYKLFLEVKQPTHLSSFEGRETEAAAAEAAVFSLFRSAGFGVVASEDPSIGGPDFLVSESGSPAFIAEVTNLGTDTVAAQSGLDRDTSEDVAVGSFSWLTEALRKRASTKAKQVAGVEVSRLLVVTCQHPSAPLLLGPNAAEELLVGGRAIRVPLGQAELTTQNVSHLRDSVFFRFDSEGEVEPARRSISAILLMALGSHSAHCVGILNPQAAVPFDFRLLAGIPFVRVARWPIEDRSLESEWVIGNPSAAVCHYSKVELRDEEFRSL